MVTLMRLVAQLIDVITCVAVLVAGLIYAAPAVFSLTGSDTVAAVVTFVLILAVIALLQYPFLKVNQTIGKAFASLEIISTNPARPLTVSILFQREVFCKLMSCYIVCVPVLVGRTGWHEISTETAVIRKK